MVALYVVVLVGIFAPAATAVTITLNPGNGFTDTLELGVSISRPGGRSRPLVGTELEFSCGASDIADFLDATSQIGGGTEGEICGYTIRTPIQIVQNEDIVTARSSVSGKLYEIDLITWDASGTCYDANGGMSCVAAAGATSYLRTLRISAHSSPNPLPPSYWPPACWPSA